MILRGKGVEGYVRGGGGGGGISEQKKLFAIFLLLVISYLPLLPRWCEWY